MEVGGKRSDDEIDLRQLIEALWLGKQWILLSTIIFSAGALIYALLSTPIFRADAVVQIRESSSGGGLGAWTSNLGGLASLVGIPSGGSGGSLRTVALATAKSRALLEAFIIEHDLMPILFDTAWDSQLRQWKLEDPALRPTVRAGIQVMSSILQIKEDKSNGLITVSIEWKDPVQAAKWVNAIIAKTNEVLRSRALSEGQATLAYLQEEVKKTPTVEIQGVAYRLMEGEMQKLMLARGTSDYALQVIDPAVVPERKMRPKRAEIAITGFIAGFVLGCLAILIASAWSNRRSELSR